VKQRLLLLVALAAAAALVLDGFAVHRSAAGREARAPATWDAVAPLFAEKCAGCHRQGGIAPFALTRARTAKAYAQSILAVTQAGVMPPWMPGRDSPAYLHQDQRILTAAEKSLIRRWVEGGARLGSGKSVTPVQAQTTAPGTSVTLQPGRAYKPHGTNGGTDDYHCFLLDPHLTRDAYVTAAQVVPQQPDVVHHVILFDAGGANVADARALNARSGGNGWTCFGGPGLSETRASANTAVSDRLGAPQWITAWVPGHTSNQLPQGTGVLLHAGDLVVMQVHYNLLHDPAHSLTDRSKVELRLTPAQGANLTPLDTYLLPAPVELPCPAGATGALCSRDAVVRKEVAEYGGDAAFIPLGLLILCHEQLQQVQGPVSTCTRTVNRPLTIYGVAGHMHLRGVDIRIDLNGRTLLHIPQWQFHWQDAYYLQQPVEANAGDALTVTCRFDPKRVKPYRYVIWGEGTTDEMCLGALQVANR
jgi:mono/diheme cytochrome c family protein